MFNLRFLFFSFLLCCLQVQAEQHQDDQFSHNKKIRDPHHKSSEDEEDDGSLKSKVILACQEKINKRLQTTSAFKEEVKQPVNVINNILAAASAGFGRRIIATSAASVNSSSQSSKNYQSNGGASSNHQNNVKVDSWYQVEDVVLDGKQYEQYIYVDKNSKCGVTCLVPYDDPNTCILYKFMQPVPVQSRIAANHQQFLGQHTQSVNQMKVHHYQNSPVVQRQIVDQNFFAGRITAEQAAEQYKQIEYSNMFQQAQKAINQIKKEKNPSIAKKTFDYFFNNNNKSKAVPSDTKSTNQSQSTQNQSSQDSKDNVQSDKPKADSVNSSKEKEDTGKESFSQNPKSNAQSDRSKAKAQNQPKVKESSSPNSKKSVERNESRQNSNDSQQKERSAVYRWCKEKKEKFVGPSKKSTEQRKNQVEAQNQSKEKESSSQSSKDNAQSDKSKTDSINSSKENTGKGSSSQNSKGNTQSDGSKVDAKNQSRGKGSSSQNSKGNAQSDGSKANAKNQSKDFSSAQTKSGKNRSESKDLPAQNNNNDYEYDYASSYNDSTSDTSSSLDKINDTVAVASDIVSALAIISEAAREEAYYKKKQEDEMLETYGYKYQVSENLKNKLEEIQAALPDAKNKYYETSFFSYDRLWYGTSFKFYKKLQDDEWDAEQAIKTEEENWRKKSLEEIEEIKKARALQEEADRIKAEQDKADRIKKQIETLIAYAYKFQLSDEKNKKLQEIQVGLALAQNRSTFEYWFTDKYRKEQNSKVQLEQIEAEIAEEERISKINALSAIAQEQLIVECNIKKNQVAQKLREELSEIQRMYLENEKNFIKNMHKQKNETQQEQILKEARQIFENEKEEQFIQEQFLIVTNNSINEILTTVAANIGLTPEDEAFQNIEIPSECYTSDNQQENKNTSSDYDNYVDRQLLENQFEWKKNNHIDQATFEDQFAIHQILDEIALSKNDTTIELAQTSLKSWEKAQKAESDEECAYHRKNFENCYKAIQSNKSIPSIAEQAGFIKKAEIEKLLENYTHAINDNNNSDKVLEEHSFDKEHFDRIKKRQQALAETKEQLDTDIVIYHTYKMSSQARGFMMAHNLNYAVFDGAAVTNFQHCLTQEILGIVESSANISQHSKNNFIVAELARYNCELAISAQQLNQLSRIEEAAAITDLSHFFELYGRSMLDDQLEAEVTARMAVGIYDGAARLLKGWNDFAIKLYNNPRQTLGDIAHGYKNIGICLLKIGAKVGEYSPLAYLNDMVEDMRDSLHQVEHGGDDQTQTSSRAQQRAARGAQEFQDGIYQVFQTAQIVIENMVNKSARENVADITEMTLDNFITGKVTESLLHLTSIVGNQALKVVGKIQNNIPPHLHGNTVSYMVTEAGELIATADTAGENIGAAIAMQKAANTAETIIKNTAKAKD
ncbi:MAG: hypothetical protein JO129_04135, partial [Candidatus Dependentiae bacterium]|nr:hypothetical protein [Candidatus Dependentiae bacterium]